MVTVKRKTSSRTAKRTEKEWGGMILEDHAPLCDINQSVLHGYLINKSFDIACNKQN